MQAGMNEPLSEELSERNYALDTESRGYKIGARIVQTYRVFKWTLLGGALVWAAFQEGGW